MAGARNNGNSNSDLIQERWWRWFGGRRRTVNGEDYTSEDIDRHLHLAALKGDWKSAQKIHNFGVNITRQITGKKETALHIAALAEQVDFVKKLVKEKNINVDYLTTGNRQHITALSYAATTGNMKIAKVMVEKLKQESEKEKVNINEQFVRPLIFAAQFGHRNMVKYLLSQFNEARDQWNEDDRFELFVACIKTNLYDVAARLLHNKDYLIRHRDRDGYTALHVLVRKPSACDGVSSFKKERHTLVEKLCKDAIRRSSRRVASSAASNATDVENSNPKAEILSLLFDAAEVGNLEVLIEFIHYDPELMWTADYDRGTIFHIAVRQRHESIFGLLRELGSTKYLIAKCLVEDGKNNITQQVFEKNILHLAAELAPRDKVSAVSGAALQMQRELLWFTEVEKIVPHSYKWMKNSTQMTPEALFEEKHEKMRSQGEKWMKTTATSSTVVAALIATVMFGAAFNVPGGFRDALSLFSSSTSALMFLSILTSRYATRDFLRKLPIKLMIGVTLLFISMAAMMVAFYAIFVLYYQHIHQLTLRLTVGCVYASLPISYFLLKYPLLLDLFYVIFKPRSLFQPPKRLLY